MKKSLIKILIFFAAIFGTFSIYLLVSNNSVYAADHTPHDGIEDHGFNIAKWDKDDSLPSFEGEYYLTKDVTLTQRWRPGKQVKLCLNGHCIKLAEQVQGSVIEFRGSDFNDEISLSIYDCSEVEHKYRINEEGLAIVDDTLTENYSTFKGGYLTGGNCGNGGCIDLTHATDGPEKISNLYMRGVNILGNKVTENGAGIYYKYEQGKKCTISLENVSIFGNVAGGKGAGIYQEASGSDNVALTLNNVNISNNRSGVTPAGIYEESSLAVKGNVYVYDNKVYNDEEKDGLEADITVNHKEGTQDDRLVVTGKLEEGSKIGYNYLRRNKIFDYYKIFDENDATKNNDADPNTIFFTNTFQSLGKDGVDITVNGFEESYKVNYDEKPHTIYLPKNFDAFKEYIKFGEKEGTYDLDVAPEFTEVGKYTIYYTYKASCFDLPVTGKQTIIIDKRLPLSPEGLTDLVYTGDKQELIKVPENPGCTYQYKLENGYWSEFIPKGMDIAKYTIFVRATGDEDHADTEFELKAEIKEPDKTQLQAKIEEGNQYEDSIKANYKAIARDLENNIKNAKAVFLISKSTESEIKDAIDNLDAAINKAKEDVATVDDVKSKIDAIGEVAFSDDSKSKIDTARTSYDALVEHYKTIITNYETLTNAEARYQELTNDNSSATVVIDAINSIGEVTLDSKSKLDEVRFSYNNLTDAQKALVTNYETLTNAESTYSKLKADRDVAVTVEESINAIGEVLYNEESKTKIDDARSKFDELSDSQKAFVTNYETLTNAEARYQELVNDANLALETENLINAIGEVDLEANDRVEAAKNKFNSLTSIQKALVKNANVLADAQTKMALILVEKSKADEVDAKIDAIGELVYNDECKEKIASAKASYNVLSESEKNYVTKFETLVSLDKSYSRVDYATKVINAIGAVSLTNESKQSINSARSYYDELSDEEKALVPNLNVLVNAESEFKQLIKDNNNTIILTVIIVILVFLGVLIGVCYILLFFVFNSWTLIRYKQKRVFKLGAKNGKIRLLRMNLRIIYRDEADVHRKK